VIEIRVLCDDAGNLIAMLKTKGLTMKPVPRCIRLWLLVLFLMPLTMVSHPAGAAGSRPPTPNVEEKTRQMSQEELQAAVLSYANRLADLLEKLPDQIADERSAAISDAEKLIARERIAVLKAIDDKAMTIGRLNTDVQQTIDRVNVAFASLQKTTGDAERLIQQTHKTTVAMQDLLGTVERLVVRFEPKDPSVPSRPFDVNEYIVAIEKIQHTLESLNKMAMGVERTTTPILTHALEQFNQAADQRVDHIFSRLFNCCSLPAASLSLSLSCIDLPGLRSPSAKWAMILLP
jgi:hypothetical protein